VFPKYDWKQGFMSEQIHIAVDLGVLAPPLPDPEFLEEFAANLPVPPAQIVDRSCTRAAR
jgi:hypothetical protein